MNFRVPQNVGRPPSGFTTGGLLSGTRLHRDGYIVMFPGIYLSANP
jgi:hypothetical protein